MPREFRRVIWPLGRMQRPGKTARCLSRLHIGGNRCRVIVNHRSRTLTDFGSKPGRVMDHTGELSHLMMIVLFPKLRTGRLSIYFRL